jgi:hypothetical protein
LHLYERSTSNASARKLYRDYNATSGRDDRGFRRWLYAAAVSSLNRQRGNRNGSACAYGNERVYRWNVPIVTSCLSGRYRWASATALSGQRWNGNRRARPNVE